MPVENSEAQLIRTADSDELYFGLSWDCGDIDGFGHTKTTGYCVYLYDIAKDTFKLITTINDPQTTTYRYQNTFDGRAYYPFMITAFSEATASNPLSSYPLTRQPEWTPIKLPLPTALTTRMVWMEKTASELRTAK